MKTLILIFISFLHYVHPQGAWMMSNRTHPELDWMTIKTGIATLSLPFILMLISYLFFLNKNREF